ELIERNMMENNTFEQILNTILLNHIEQDIDRLVRDLKVTIGAEFDTVSGSADNQTFSSQNEN
ncbi:24331_t:CDS:2, partial [Racocetra persica]